MGDEEFSNPLSEITWKLSELDKMTTAAMPAAWNRRPAPSAETGRNSYATTYQWQLLHAILLAHPLPAAIERETGPGGGT